MSQSHWSKLDCAMSVPSCVQALLTTTCPRPLPDHKQAVATNRLLPEPPGMICEMLHQILATGSFGGIDHPQEQAHTKKPEKSSILWPVCTCEHDNLQAVSRRGAASPSTAGQGSHGCSASLMHAVCKCEKPAHAVDIRYRCGARSVCKDEEPAQPVGVRHGGNDCSLCSLSQSLHGQQP